MSWCHRDVNWRLNKRRKIRFIRLLKTDKVNSCCGYKPNIFSEMKKLVAPLISQHLEKNLVLTQRFSLPPPPGYCRMVWRWRDCAWGTSFTTTTPNEACGTPKTRKLPRDSAPCWSDDSEPTCRSTVCERGPLELAHCLNSAFFFLNRLLSGTASVSPPAPLACLSVRGNGVQIWTLQASGLRRQTWVITLPHWLNYCTERRELFLFSFSLSFFWCNVFRQTGKQLFSCVCVCVWVYEWVCIYINVCGCVAACVCLWWKEAPFFLTRRCEDNLRSLFLTRSHMGA